MNSAYISKLMELAEKDRGVMHLLADSGTAYDDMFRRYFPEQIINFGISEENMVSAAAGMATVGKIPFIFAQGAFLAYRSLEFIRDNICFQNLNVKLVGTGSGLSLSSLGPTHHTTEDVSILRVLPNLTLLSPATPIQVKACVQKAYEQDGPIYIKIGMNHEKEYFEDGYVFPRSGMESMREGRNVLIFTTGSILEEVMNAAERLDLEKIGTKVVNVVSLKPFDEGAALDFIEGFSMVYCVEEQNVIGGLSGILAEAMAHAGVGKKLISIGLNDAFAEGYGSYDMVRRRNGLDAKSIAQKIKETYKI